MMNPDISPEEAKKLAAGPLGAELAKFPLRFATPVFFGDLPPTNAPAKINNGTASLIDLGHGPLAITCCHVLDTFKEKLKNGERCLFQLGDCRLNPIDQLISEDEELDIAIIELTKDQAIKITKNSQFGSDFFKPSSWPSNPISENEFIAFSGFPGKWRTQMNTATLEFGSYSSGASRVESVSDIYFVTQFEREYWIQSLGVKDAVHLKELGGLSGGPAFVSRGLRFDFAGIIYEFSSDYELLYLRHSNILDSNGQINK